MSESSCGGDWAFAREEIMSWGEANGVDDVFSLGKHQRLLAQIRKPMEQAQIIYDDDHGPGGTGLP